MAQELYNQLSKYTDASYRRIKNYRKEVDFILRRVGNRAASKIVIDVACGSGGHAELLSRAGFEVYAVDLNPGMLRLFRKNVPSAHILKQDMRQLHVPAQADLVICMFNAINYNYSYAEFSRTLQRFYDHLKPGGVVIFDTAFMKHTWRPGAFSVDTMTTPDFDLVRANKSYRKSSFGIVEIVYIVFEKGRKKIVETQNKIFLFDPDRILTLMKQIGYKPKVYFDFSDRKRNGIVSVFVGQKK